MKSCQCSLWKKQNDLEVNESEDHIDKMMSFWRTFDADGYYWIDDSKLSFSSCYHYDRNEARSVL